MKVSGGFGGQKSWTFLEKASALRKEDKSDSHANNTDET